LKERNQEYQIQKRFEEHCSDPPPFADISHRQQFPLIQIEKDLNQDFHRKSIHLKQKNIEIDLNFLI